MNSLKIGHELGELIARRKTGEMGEFSYVCLRSGEERRGRGEILELVKEKNKEGWCKVRELGGEGVTDNDFEARVRKLVAKLPWEKANEKYMAVREAKSECDKTDNGHQSEKMDAIPMAVQEVKPKIELKQEKDEKHMPVISQEISHSMDIKEPRLENNQVYSTKSEREEPLDWGVKEEDTRVKNEFYNDEDEDNGSGDPDAEIIAAMNYRYACLSETCVKMFQKWKPCKKHMVQCAGIHSTKANFKDLENKSNNKAKKQGAVHKRGGLKKGLLPQTPGGPSEEDLVTAVENFYASLKKQENRKHVLAHLRKLYGKGEFRRFGFGTFIEFAKKHGLDVYNDEQNKMIKHRRQITIQILQKVIRKFRTPCGKLNFYCNTCCCDLNSNNKTGEDMDKRKEAREHIQDCHEEIYREVTQQIGYGQARTSDIIEENLRGKFHFVNQQIKHENQQHKQDIQLQSNPGNGSMKRVNESAKEDILSRLSEVFFRTGNIYHCIVCDNKPIGGAKKEAREHLSHNHIQEEMAMKEFIKQKYDTFVCNNFETFLRLVLHKVETF